MRAPGNCLEGNVIGRRTQAAGGDDDIAAFKRPPDCIRDGLLFIADRAVALDVDSQARKPLRKVGRIAIHALTAK